MSLTDEQLQEISNLWGFGPGMVRHPSMGQLVRGCRAIGCKLPSEEEKDQAFKIAFAGWMALRKEAKKVRDVEVKWEGVVIEDPETKIRMMKPEEVREAIKRLNISVEAHPTNNGITAMRMRNALYGWVKKGNVI